MKILITYSSRTGNTKKIAEAIYEVFQEEAELLPIQKVEDISPYEYIFVGGWADKGTLDSKALEFIQEIKEKKIAIFATLGAYPYSIHAHEILVRTAEKVDKSNRIVGSFICQGAVDPALLKRFESFPKDDPHYPNARSRKRHEIAANKPDEEDCKEAQKIFRQMIERDVDA